jgi:hypothetical protein
MLRLVALCAAAALVAARVAHGRVAAAGALQITQRFEGQRFYIEGSISLVRIQRAGRTGGQPRMLEPAGGRVAKLTVKLAAGRYHLYSWQRPCDGNCSLLDPPADRCSTGFRIASGRVTRATIHVMPGQGCRIVVRAS